MFPPPILGPDINSSNLMTDLTTPFPTTLPYLPFALPTLSSLDVELCTHDRQVKYDFIDDTCQEIKYICLQYIVSEEDREYFSHNLDSYCLARRKLYVKGQGFHCYSTDHTPEIDSLQYLFREHFVKETQDQMISQLKSIKVELFTNMNITMTNETFFDMNNHYFYDLHIISTEIKTLHIDILNNNFHRVHLQLDNNDISAQIKDNVFVEAGVTISSTPTHVHQPVVFENNTFQGKNSKTILEVRNTTKVSINSTIFRNIFGRTTLVNAIPGMVCHNSQIEIRGIFFQSVHFFPVLQISNCTVTIQNLEISDTDFSSYYIPLLLRLLSISYSDVVIKNSHFRNNTYAQCFDVSSGNVTFQNMNVFDNDAGHVGSILEAVVNINNASLFNNEGVIFVVQYSTMIINSCKFKLNLHLNSYPIMFASHFEFSESRVNITDSIFESNTKGSALLSITSQAEVFLTRNSFVFNRNINYLILANINDDDGYSLIQTYSANIIIDDSTFDYNQNVIQLSEGSANFTNCVFNNNLASVGGVAKVFSGSMQFDNCSFSNNMASIHGGVLLAVGSQVALYRCSVVNNSASSEAGAISISEHSFLLLENSTFEYNSCGVDGGAITAHRNSSLIISYSIFLINKALGVDGGAIFLEDESQLESYSCQFIGNTAMSGGGAVMVIDHSSYSDTGSTFTNNIAADNGKFITCFLKSLFLFLMLCDLIFPYFCKIIF